MINYENFNLLIDLLAAFTILNLIAFVVGGVLLFFHLYDNEIKRDKERLQKEFDKGFEKGKNSK